MTLENFLTDIIVVMTAGMGLTFFGLVAVDFVNQLIIKVKSK